MIACLILGLFASMFLAMLGFAESLPSWIGSIGWLFVSVIIMYSIFDIHFSKTQNTIDLSLLNSHGEKDE